MITFNNTFLNGNILQNGLRYDFDGSKKESYPEPKTGLSVFDLSGNAMTTSLNAAITYNTANEGVFNFNNGSASFPYTLGNNSIFTIGLWIKFATASNPFKNIFGVINGPGVAFSTGNGGGGVGTRVHLHFGQVTFSPVSGFHTIVAGNWVHFTLARKPGLNSFYVNGLLNSTGTSNNFAATNAGVIGPSSLDAQVGKAYIYTKELSAQDVLFNHNVTKGRFGL